MMIIKCKSESQDELVKELKKAISELFVEKNRIMDEIYVYDNYESWLLENKEV